MKSVQPHPGAQARPQPARGAFAAGAWSYVVFGAGLTVVGPTLQPMREAFKVGHAQVGLIFLVMSLGYVAAALLSGPISDRRGRRPFLVGGPVLMAAGYGIVSLGPSWPVLLLGMLVTGAGLGMLDGPLNALVLDFAHAESAAMLNFLHLFFGAGALAGPLIAGAALALGLDWRLIYLAVAALALTVVPPFVFARLPAGRVAEPPSIGELAAAVRRPLVLLMMALLIFYVGVEVAYGGWLASYLELELGLARAAAATSVSVFWAGILVGRLLTGLLARRLDPLKILTAATAAAALLGFAAVLIRNPLAAILSFGIVGVLISGAFPTALAIGVAGYERMAGALTGFMIAAAGVGGLSLPPLAGAMADALGLRAAMLAAAGLSALAAGASYWGTLHRGPVLPDAVPNTALRELKRSEE